MFNIFSETGKFDVLYFTGSDYFVKGISKPYKKYGTGAWREALLEAISRVEHDNPDAKIPASLLVVDRATLKLKAFDNRREIKLSDSSVERKLENYKELCRTSG